MSDFKIKNPTEEQLEFSEYVNNKSDEEQVAALKLTDYIMLIFVAFLLITPFLFGCLLILDDILKGVGNLNILYPNSLNGLGVALAMSMVLVFNTANDLNRNKEDK